MAGIFEVRIYKSIGGGGGPKSQHSNVYHIRSENELNTDDLVFQVNALVTFEKTFHNDNVAFKRAVIKPYGATGTDPENLRTIALSGNGALVSESQIEPKEITLKCAATAEMGRAGGCYYRGALVETDVNAEPSGDATQENGVSGRITGAWAAYIAVVGHADVVLPKKGDVTPASARLVTKIVFQGIICKKATNRRRKAPASAESSVGAVIGFIATLASIAAIVSKLGPLIPAPVKGRLIIELRRAYDIIADILTKLGSAIT